MLRAPKPVLVALAADALASRVLGSHQDAFLAAAAAAAAVAGGYSSAAATAVQQVTDRHLQGDLPRVPSMPARSLLMRKLVQLERLLRPAEDQHKDEAADSDKAKARAARQATADAYLSAVSAAAARQDIAALLQQLSGAASPPQQQQQQHMPWLLPAALTLATRQLAAGEGGKPQFAQALVELVLDQGLVEPQRAQRAIHAVLQAYADAEDYPGVLAAAARFFDLDSSMSSSDPEASSSSSLDASSSSSSKWGLRPSSVTLALLLDAAAAQGDAALLMGVWKYFGPGSLQQQHADAGSTGQHSDGGKAAGALPPPVVLHALTYGAVMCDLAGAPQSDLPDSSSSSSSSTGVSPLIFRPDSCTVDVLHQVYRLASNGHNQGSIPHLADNWQPKQQGSSSSSSGSSSSSRRHRHKKLLLPVPLLHPDQGSKLLRRCHSAADIDLLLLSQLYQRGGLGPRDLTSLQQQLQDAAAAAEAARMSQQQDSDSHSLLLQGDTQPAVDSSSSSSSSSRGVYVMDPRAQLPSQLLDQLPAVSQSPQPPAFPPALRADVAYAAVEAYLRAGAFGRAAAVAHAAAVQHPGDIQQFHLLVRGAAAAGAALPGLVVVEKLREALWQLPSPKAQAAMLRALARNGASPPLGAAPSPARLATFYSRFCTPHPDTWGALLQGLVVAGDRGNRTFKTLRVALTQPYAYLALPGCSPEAVDKARSRIIAALLRGVLAACEQRSRLCAVSGAASQLLQEQGSGSAVSCSSDAVGVLGGSRSRSAQVDLLAVLDVSPAAAKQAALLNVLQQSGSPASSSSSGGDGSVELGQSGSGWWPAVQQAAPGLPLQQQPVFTRLKVVVVLQVLQLLKAWGVRVQHDAALAAALQVLRYCWDTEDARQSAGLLVEVLRAALDLGIQPSGATLKALLACCADLESRPGKTPLGLASGPGFNLEGVGYVDLGQVLSACRKAVQDEMAEQQQGSQVSAAGAGIRDVGVGRGESGSSGDVTGTAAEQLAAELLRTWVFNATFAFVEGVRSHGPTWPLTGVGSTGADSTAEVSAAVGA